MGLKSKDIIRLVRPDYGDLRPLCMDGTRIEVCSGQSGKKHTFLVQEISEGFGN